MITILYMSDDMDNDMSESLFEIFYHVMFQRICSFTETQLVLKFDGRKFRNYTQQAVTNNFTV